MSRQTLDRARSKIGPGPVHYFACVSEFLRQRFHGQPKKAVPGLIADELGMSASAVRKWLFRHPQHLPGPDARRAIARAYGRALAAQADMPFEDWREAFLYGEPVCLGEPACLGEPVARPAETAVAA